MKDSFFKDLKEELDQAKKENPLLEGDVPSELLEKSIDENITLHGSHNSHGDWGKHWAHGGYTDEEDPGSSFKP